MTQPASPVDIRSKIAHCLRLDMLTRLECAPQLAEALAGFGVLSATPEWMDARDSALAAWREGAKG